MKRVVKTTAAGSVGFLGGLLLERGLETLTGVDFADGLFAAGGAVLAAASVNKELVQAAADNMRKMFGKEPQDLTRDEWEEYKKKYPRIANLMEKALQV